MPEQRELIQQAAAILRSGGLVAIPTETVYGLAADALNPAAVARIFEVKRRPLFDPLIVHIADRSWLPRLTLHVSDAARRLADHFWPGPLTLVLPKAEAVPDLVTSGGPTVAIRIPRHPLTLELLRTADCCVAAPSANLFGRLSPTTADAVKEQLGDAVDLVLDGGPCSVGVESTVVQCDDTFCRVLRPGGISVEQLESVLGKLVERGVSQAKTSELAGIVVPNSPGMLPQHYAPRTKLVIASVPFVRTDYPPDAAFLRFCNSVGLHPNDRVEILSQTADLAEAAAGFFAALRRLDASGAALIVVESFPNTGLGVALNDRLTRAAAS